MKNHMKLTDPLHHSSYWLITQLHKQTKVQIKPHPLGSTQLLDVLDNILMPCPPPHLLHPSHPSSFFYHIHFQDRKFFKGFFAKVSYCFCVSECFSCTLASLFIFPLSHFPLWSHLRPGRNTHTHSYRCVQCVWNETNTVIVCVCVCLRERERELVGCFRLEQGIFNICVWFYFNGCAFSPFSPPEPKLEEWTISVNE